MRTAAGHGQELVLAVQQGQLAAVARRELPHRQRRPRSRSPSSHLHQGRGLGPVQHRSVATEHHRARSGTVRSARPHRPSTVPGTPRPAARSAPAATRSAAARRIMISGPHSDGRDSGLESSRLSVEVTRPTSPCQPRPARSTVTCTSAVLGPVVDLRRIQDLGRGPRTDDQDDPGIWTSAAVPEQPLDVQSQRGQPDPAADHDHRIGPDRPATSRCRTDRGGRPRSPVRTAHSGAGGGTRPPGW